MNPTRRTITADAQHIIAHLDRLRDDLSQAAPELVKEHDQALRYACAAVDDVVTDLAHRPAAVTRTHWPQHIHRAIRDGR